MYGRGGGGGYRRGPVGFGGGLSLTPMVRNIIVANVVVWFITLQWPDLITLLWVDGFNFRPWQPFTYMWLHDTNNALHIISNMLGLYFFGCELERAWGPQRFLRFYVACGAGAGFIIWIADLLFGPHYTLGASGAVFGVITGYSVTWPDRTIQLLFPPIPMRAAWLIPVLFVLQLSMSGDVSHVGHLGGVIVALIDLRRSIGPQLSIRSLRYRWNRFRMRNRLRAVRREDWQRRTVRDDDDHPTLH